VVDDGDIDVMEMLDDDVIEIVIVM